MKKVLSLVALLIIMMVTLTGCVTVDYQVTINKNGTGKISYVYGFEKSFLEQMGTSSDEMVAEMKESAEAEGYSAEAYSDDKVQGFKATKEVEDITADLSLSEVFGANVKDTDDSNIKIEKRTFGTKYSQKGTIDLTDMEDMSAYGVVIKYSVNLPVKVGNNNASNVSKDGKTLTWELKGGEENSIEFTATALSSIMIGLIALGIIIILAVIIVVILILVRKSKKGKQDKTIENDPDDELIAVEDENNDEELEDKNEEE